MKCTDRALKPIAVFLGPSLHKDQARLLLDADYYPPARKGDVYRIMASGVRTIVLIDGVFHSTPSIWQRELLDAMGEEIQVLGASSMGALRAAELHEFGMIGFGKIFEWYRDGIIDGDDEVALWHETEEHDYRPLSEPLVNIRYTLLKALEENYLTPDQTREMTAYAKKLFYPQRSYRQLLNGPVVKSWSEDQVARLEHYFQTKAIDLKMVDAIGILRYCATRSKRRRRDSKSVDRSFQSDTRSFWNYERLIMSGFINSHGVITGEQVLNEAYRDPAEVETMRTILSERYFLMEWARQNGVSWPEEVLQTLLKQWEEQHPNNHRAWLRANGLTQKTYRMLAAQHALIHWITTKGCRYFGLDTSFILEWARQNGISLTQESRDHSCEPTKEALERWIVKQGPSYFGLRWNFDAALLQELQIRGRAAELINEIEAR